MKKSTILFTVLAVTAFLAATVLGLQNPNIPENQNEIPESPEFAPETTISDNPPENNDLSLSLVCSFLNP